MNHPTLRLPLRLYDDKAGGSIRPRGNHIVGRITSSSRVTFANGDCRLYQRLLGQTLVRVQRPTPTSTAPTMMAQEETLAVASPVAGVLAVLADRPTVDAVTDAAASVEGEVGEVGTIEVPGLVAIANSEKSLDENVRVRVATS